MRAPLSLRPVIVLLASLLLLSIAALPTRAQQGPLEEILCFRRGSDALCLPRALQEPADAWSDSGGDLVGHLGRVLRALVAGPTGAEQAAGVWSAIPAGSNLHGLDLSGTRLIIRLELPEHYLTEAFNPLLSDQLVEQVAKTLDPFRAEIIDAAGIRAGSPDDRLVVHVMARDPWEPDQPFRDLSHFLFEPPLTRKPLGTTLTNAASSDSDSPIATVPTTDGSLSGKTVYISAGHGWYWHETSQRWLTQRPVWQDLIEDFNNAEVVNQYLLPYLVNAGADVWTVRERELATQETVVTLESPGYVQIGVWREPPGPVTGSTLIFPWRYASTSDKATVKATWTFTPEETARQAVYVWYAPGPDRAPDARYRIAHAGGDSIVRIDQTVHGLTWRYLGSYPFRAGEVASISLSNMSDAPGTIVSAGAVRVGGGMGSERGEGEPLSPTTSGRPRWEEASRYYAKYLGAPPSVYHPSTSDGLDDVTARPRYAEWESPAGEDAVFISWHTNGSAYHTSKGTQSYIYDGSYGGTWTPGSDALQVALHQTLVEDIRASWDPGWIDGGKRAYNFGEVRPLETMPGVLLEIAYHDIADEARALLDPRFAQISARAIYRGIVRYFAQRQGLAPVFLPEPPAGLALRNSGPGELTLTWLPSPTDGVGPLGDEPTGYLVYTSPDGFAWGSPQSVAGTSYTLHDQIPGNLVFARVTGVNQGGESLPSPTLAARLPADDHVAILVVDGFARNDDTFTVWQDDGVSIEDTSRTGPSRRLYAAQTNRRDYTIQHGFAINAPFDSATRQMLQTQGEGLPATVQLGDYTIVDWISGRERSPDAAIPIAASDMALTTSEQALLTDFVAYGGSLFISGSDVGLDLAERGLGLDFYTGILKAAYWGDSASPGEGVTSQVLPAAGGLFDGLGMFQLDDGRRGTYDAGRVDYFSPVLDDARARAALVYESGIGQAGLTWAAHTCSRVVYFGFPFETIYPVEARQAVMDGILSFLAPCASRSIIYMPILTH